MLTRVLGALFVCAVLVAACGDDSSTTTKQDKGTTTPDQGTTPDGGVDSTTDMIADDTGVPDMELTDGPAGDTQVTDGPAGDTQVADGPVGDAQVTDGPVGDAQVTDGPVGDAAPAKAEVLFSKNAAASKYTLATVALDGTGYQAVSSLPADLDICALAITGLRGPVDVRRDMPQNMSWGGEDYIHLPGGLGRLYRVYDGTDYGLLLVKADATFSLVLAKGATTTTCGTTYRIQVSDDGKLAAVVLDDNKVALLKLDGTTWAGTTPASPVLDITPTGGTIATILYNSLTMGSDSLLFVAQDGSGDDSLYSAPLDGSAKGTQIAMPNVGSSAPVHIGTDFAVSGDGKVFATTAGSTSAKEDVIVIKAGTATNISKLNDNLYATGFYMFDEMSPRIALSKNGTYVVFGATSTATAANASKTWVAKTDGTSTVEISTGGNFVRSSNKNVDVDQYGAFYFTDDDNLLFWAGVSSGSADLFHYKVSTGALANLTKTGTKSAAPWDGGSWEADGGWVNPSGSHLFLVAGATGAMNIIAVNLTGFAKSDISTGLNIDSESDLDVDMEGQEGSASVWFVARKTGRTVAIEDLFVFDQNAATAASLENLTGHTGTAAIAISSLAISPDATYASYVTGSGGSAILYTVTSSASPVALNGSGSQVGPYAWKADSAGIVYGGGTTADKLDLFLVAAAGGTPTTLHAAQSFVHVFAAK